METTRQNKIARLLQKELSDIFLLQTKSMPGVLISVSAVRISPDLSVARAYLSIFPSEKAEEIIKNVNDNMKSIRYEFIDIHFWNAQNTKIVVCRELLVISLQKTERIQLKDWN